MNMRMIAVLMLVAILAQPVALYAQETDPVAVVMGRAEALNAGDVEATAAFFAEDAVYNIIPPPPGVQGTFNGLEEIRGRLTDVIATNANIEIEISQVEGDKVTTLTRYAADDLQSMGLSFIEGIEEYAVQDGKITSYTWTTTEESMAKLMEVEPQPEELPETGGQTVPVYVLAIVLGSVAFLSGLGLALVHNRSSQT